MECVQFFSVSMTIEASPDVVPERTLHCIEFTGSASAFFRIWIVNLCLTLLTLGIYAPWARVRSRRYLMEHTRLMGEPFLYFADPRRILIGFLIISLFFLLYNYFSYMEVLWGILAIIVIYAVAIPWMLVKSRRFNARYSQYRGIRFGYAGPYRKAYLYYLLMPLLAIPTLGALYPFVRHRQTRFYVNGHRYGSTFFQFSGNVGEFYKYWAITAAIASGLLMVMGILFVGAVIIVKTYVPASEESHEILALIYIAIGLFYVGYYFVYSYYKTKLTNYRWRHTWIGANYFYSDIPVMKQYWITISNFFMVLFSLGLLYPFARIRQMRFRLSHLFLITQGDVNVFLGQEELDVSAIGEGGSAYFDFDFGF
jgi:uncharacterized membrane protein YjgN (DUF898 family)